MISKLDTGRRVTSQQLRKAIGETHWLDHMNRVAERKIRIKHAANARSALKDYTKLLQIADLHEGKQHLSGRSKTGYQKIETQPDSKYERALERLDELLAQDPSIIQFLDRAQDWNDKATGGLNGADKHTVPRSIYNKKWVYGNAVYQPLPQVRELQLQALEAAIANPTPVPEISDFREEERSQQQNREIQMNKLRSMVRR